MKEKRQEKKVYEKQCRNVKKNVQTEQKNNNKNLENKRTFGIKYMFCISPFLILNELSNICHLN